MLKGVTPEQISLAWLMAQKPWIVPIPGTTNPNHLKENMGAVNVQFTASDWEEFNTAFAQLEVYGGRLDAVQMKQIGQDIENKSN